MKKIEEYTDRELIEKTFLNSKTAASSAVFVKKLVIIVCSLWAFVFLAKLAISFTSLL